MGVYPGLTKPTKEDPVRYWLLIYLIIVPCVVAIKTGNWFNRKLYKLGQKREE